MYTCEDRSRSGNSCPVIQLPCSQGHIVPTRTERLHGNVREFKNLKKKSGRSQGLLNYSNKVLGNPSLIDVKNANNQIKNVKIIKIIKLINNKNKIKNNSKYNKII